jgi:hypothetical protein
MNLRGKFTTDADGRFWFRSVKLNLNSFGVACGREMADFCGFREVWIES